MNLGHRMRLQAKNGAKVNKAAPKNPKKIGIGISNVG